MHESELSEDEGMVVDMSDGTLRRGTDMSEAAASLSVGADGAVVHVTLWRLDGLVDGGSEACVGLAIFALAGDASFKVAVGGSVPGNAETVGVQDAVASVGFVFCGDFVGEVGDEARQVVIIDLIGEGMLRCNQDIGEKTGFCWRDVCKPTAHVGLGVG